MESFLDGLRSLERQPFVGYVTAVDRNGYSIAATGSADEHVASYIRELRNCSEEIFPGAKNVKIVVEGTTNSVVVGEREDIIVGVQVAKDMF